MFFKCPLLCKENRKRPFQRISERGILVNDETGRKYLKKYVYVLYISSKVA